MSPGSLEKKASPSKRPQASKFHEGMYWIAPLSLGTIAVTVVLVQNPASGAVIAGILAIPVAVAGVVAAAMAIPRKAGPRGRPVARSGTKWHKALPTVVSILLVAAILYVTDGTRQVGARSFLTGEVKIGISGEIPGWSTRTGPEAGVNGYAGFEIDLIVFLQRKYGFSAVPVVVPPASQYQYLIDGRVDLIVANFEITGPRSMVINYAGPYFTDSYGIYTSLAKEKGMLRHPGAGLNDGKLTICTTEPQLPLGQGVIYKYGHLEIESSNQLCLKRFLDKRDDVDSITMNKSVLVSLLEAQNFDLRNLRSVQTLTPVVEYGIGVPRKNAELCDLLADDISLWLSRDGRKSMEKHLPFLLDGSSDELSIDPYPLYTNPTTCRH